MKVDIRDTEALSALSLGALRAYLQTRMWREGERWGDRATIFTKEGTERSWEIIVPLRDTIGGYAAGMAEAIATLAVVEERSQLDVFADVKGAGSDAIHLHAVNGHGNKALSLPQSAELLGDAYGMLAAAARSVDQPRLAYRGKLSAEVKEFLDTVQPLSGLFLGYNLTLHSPVRPRIGDAQQDLFGEQDPFARRTTRRLAEALQHADAAAADALAEDSLEPFDRAVEYGVSANLCDSVAAMATQSGGIGIDLTWARVRPADPPAAQFLFSDAAAGVLQEAARSFRANEPLLDEAVTGQVIRLERDIHEFDGRAVVLFVRERRPMRLLVQFEQAAYNTVIRAFQERCTVRMDGDIYRTGNTFELRTPRNLQLLDS